MLGTQTLLGLAIDDSGIVAAEVRGRANRPEIIRAARMVFDEKLDQENVTDTGHELRQFLRANRFSSKRAVIGIPTKWIVSRQIVAPPAAADALEGMLAIQAERAFSLNAGELIFDYCGRAGMSEESEVLLVAAQRQVVGLLRELADAAGLQLRYVTVSAMALGRACSQTNPSARYGLYAQPTYCEFWSQSNGKVRSMQHVPMASAADANERADILASTIQRLVLLSPKQGQSDPHEMIVYDGCGLSDGTLNRLGERLAPQIKAIDGSGALMPGEPACSDAGEHAQSVAAASLAVTIMGANKPSVDFLNPRIGRRKKSNHKRVKSWAAVAAIVFVVGVGAIVADWRSKSADIAACTEQLELISDDVAAARELVDRISYAGSWTSRGPRFLECVRQLTLAFPESPSAWATSLAVSEQAEGSLVGKAVDEASFYRVLDNLKQNESFSDVMMMHLRDAGAGAMEEEFAVTFKFEGLK